MDQNTSAHDRANPSNGTANDRRQKRVVSYSLNNPDCETDTDGDGQFVRQQSHIADVRAGCRVEDRPPLTAGKCRKVWLGSEVPIDLNFSALLLAV